MIHMVGKGGGRGREGGGAGVRVEMVFQNDTCMHYIFSAWHRFPLPSISHLRDNPVVDIVLLILITS